MTRGAAAVLVAGAILVLSFRVFKQQVGKHFQWAVGGLAVICALAAIGMDVFGSRYGRRPEPPVQPVGSLSYRMDVADLVLLKEGVAVVLLERSLSVVDVTDPRAPSEIGRVEKLGWRFDRLALSDTRAYVWGEFRDSVGVAVFDICRLDRPFLQAVKLSYPVEKGPTPWLSRIPRLVGWATWDGRLYAGLIRNRFLELHSFDVSEKGSPSLHHIFPIEKTEKHIWNNDWAMRFLGPHAFLTLGHDFVVLNIDDPVRTTVLSRTPLRRFGRSVAYEQLVQDLHEDLASGSLKERYENELEKAREEFGAMYWRFFKPRGLTGDMIAAPPGMGPLTVETGRAYIERHLPRETSIVDTSDPRKPAEVDYLPWTRLPRLMMIDGESAYSLQLNAIQTYARTNYGVFQWKERLQLDNQLTDRLAAVNFGSDTKKTPRGRDMFVLGGDHIYALLMNHLAIFKNPRKTE